MAKRVIQIAIVIVAVAAAVAINLRARRNDASPAAGEQSAGFRPAEIDLGDQLWGRTIPVELTFVNDGAAPLTIASAKSSCGCVVLDKADFENHTVRPGASLKLSLKLDTRKSPGEKHRTVELTTTAGAEYSAAIRLNVVGTWSLSTDILKFGGVAIAPKSEPVSQTVTYESTQDELLDVSVGKTPWLECRRGRRSAGREELIIRVLPDKLTPGPLNAYVRIRTSSELNPTGTIRIAVQGLYELSAKPDPVLLIIEDRRRVEFFDRDGARVRIVSARVSDASIACKVLEDGAVEVWAAGDPSPDESPRLIVEDEAGRSRSVVVSLY